MYSLLLTQAPLRGRTLPPMLRQEGTCLADPLASPRKVPVASRIAPGLLPPCAGALGSLPKVELRTTTDSAESAPQPPPPPPPPSPRHNHYCLHHLTEELHHRQTVSPLCSLSKFCLNPQPKPPTLVLCRIQHPSILAQRRPPSALTLHSPLLLPVSSLLLSESRPCLPVSASTYDSDFFFHPEPFPLARNSFLSLSTQAILRCVDHLYPVARS
ncbi:hypothetical protein BGZ63DRAFT_407761 [Mariannaea sp. PMI_226]|nr:hypothetical protein BGZ63DRAFT_407761 [Mariannaea sp. PMI_226]